MTDVVPSKAPVGVLWDFENASVPRGVSGLFIAKRFQEVFTAYGPVLSILAIGNTDLLSQELQTELTLGAIKLVNAKPLKHEKNVADKLLMAEMFLWALDHPAPSTIVLISADVDFATSISALKLRGFNIVLVPPKTASRRMMELPNSVIHWNQVCQPVSTTSARNSMHRNDVDFMSDSSDQETSSQNTISLSSPTSSQSRLLTSSAANPTPAAPTSRTHASPSSPTSEPLLGDEADNCNEVDLLDVCLSFADQGLDRVLLSRVGLEMQKKYPNYRKGTIGPLVDRALKAGWIKKEGYLGSATLIFDKTQLETVWESLNGS